MKKLTLLIILITSMVKAQTFDFKCAANWSITTDNDGVDRIANSDYPGYRIEEPVAPNYYYSIYFVDEFLITKFDLTDAQSYIENLPAIPKYNSFEEWAIEHDWVNHWIQTSSYYRRQWYPSNLGYCRVTLTYYSPGNYNYSSYNSGALTLGIGSDIGFDYRINSDSRFDGNLNILYEVIRRKWNDPILIRHPDTHACTSDRYLWNYYNPNSIVPEEYDYISWTTNPDYFEHGTSYTVKYIFNEPNQYTVSTSGGEIIVESFDDAREIINSDKHIDIKLRKTVEGVEGTLDGRWDLLFEGKTVYMIRYNVAYDITNSMPIFVPPTTNTSNDAYTTITLPIEFYDIYHYHNYYEVDLLIF